MCDWVFWTVDGWRVHLRRGRALHDQVWPGIVRSWTCDRDSSLFTVHVVSTDCLLFEQVWKAMLLSHTRLFIHYDRTCRFLLHERVHEWSQMRAIHHSYDITSDGWGVRPPNSVYKYHLHRTRKILRHRFWRVTSHIIVGIPDRVAPSRWDSRRDFCSKSWILYGKSDLVGHIGGRVALHVILGVAWWTD